MLFDLVFVVIPMVGFMVGVLSIRSVSLFVLICVGVFSSFLLFGFWIGSSLVIVSFFFLVVGGIMCVFAYVSSFSFSYVSKEYPVLLLSVFVFSPFLLVYLFDWNFSFFVGGILYSWEFSFTLGVAGIIVLVLVVISMSFFLFVSFGSVRPSSI